MRTVQWNYDSNVLEIIDQRLLPQEFKVISLSDYQSVIDAIKNMAVRGAPAIGATGAFGLALAAYQIKAEDIEGFIDKISEVASYIKEARPTAVNLTWAVDRIIEALTRNKTGLTLPFAPDYVLKEAQAIADEDVEINKSMARYGAELLKDGDTVIHHCNTGALATVDWGTALGVIRMAHEQGKKIHVLVDETRPRLQGSRLTAWELEQYGISYDIITDNAAGYFLSKGAVDAVLFGADRVAANGDVANKIGTYLLALAANESRVPAYAVVPTSTIDVSLSDGESIPIEERPENEVLGLTWHGQPVVPPSATARNPAFDITPNKLIAKFVTEYGLLEPPFSKSIEMLFAKIRKSESL